MRKLLIMLLAVVSIMSCSSDNNATTILENNTFSEVWKLKSVTLETSSNNALLDDILKEHFAELIDKDEAWYLGFEEQKHYTLIHQKAGKIQVLSKGNFLYHDPVPLFVCTIRNMVKVQTTSKSLIS